MKTFEYKFVGKIRRNRKGEVVEFVYKGRSWTKKSLWHRLQDDLAVKAAACKVLDDNGWWKPCHVGVVPESRALKLQAYRDVIWAKALRNLSIKPVSLVTFSTPRNYRKS